MATVETNVQERALGKSLLVASSFAFGAYILLVIAQPMLFNKRFGVGSDIAGVNVSGKTATEAVVLLEQRWAEYSQKDVTVQGTDIPVSSLVSELKAAETVKDAISNEERGYFTLSKYLGRSHITDLTYNEDEMSKLLLTLYDSEAVRPVDAVITDIDKGKVRAESEGQRLLLPESKEALLEGLSSLSGAISLRVTPMTPNLTESAATALISSVQEAVKLPISVTGAEITEKIDTPTLKSWLKLTPMSAHTVVEQETLLPQSEDGYYYLDQSKIHAYASKLAKQTNKEAKNIVFDNIDGKMTIKTPAIIGRELDKTTLINDIEEAVKDGHKVTLSLSTKQPEVSEDNLDDLGIKEMISEGWTNAAGSPVNRIHNYTVGASKFNGVLIKPDEDVSFNTILGPVEKSTGYLPELVILADKTVPEYGGGLCQVSSTAFRAALNAGLPILERHNHAYPVSYYTPYGVDATIYLPSPDLRFKNDTGHYIYIQAGVNGKNVYFDFYGTKKPGKVTFSGNADANGAVSVVEKVSPSITDRDSRGPKSFTATFYRHIYDAAGKLIDNDKFTSKYDSPDKYPH